MKNTLCPVDNCVIVLSRAIIGPAGGHGPDCPAAHPVDGDRIVIHTDRIAIRILLVQRRNYGLHFFYVVIQDILDQIGLMNSQICHSAHGGLLPVEEPGIILHDTPVLRTFMAEGGPECEDSSDRAFPDQLSCFLVPMSQTLVLPDHECTVILIRCLHHGLTLLYGNRHRLLAQDVLTGIQGFDGDFRMLRIRHTHTYYIDGRICKKLVHRLIYSASVLCGQLLRAVTVPVTVPCDLRIRIRCVFRNMTVPGNASAANDTCFDHTVTLLVENANAIHRL